ncbi:MAG: tetratricopeptide repeat protein [bacterium]
MPNIFNRIIKISIYSLIFLLPLLFSPFSFEPFEFNKQYLLFFLVSLGLFAWLAKMILVDKEVRLKRTPLDLPILLFLFIAILSAVFSVDKSSSLFGFYEKFSDGLIGLISFVILYFLVVNNVCLNKDKKNSQGASFSGISKTFTLSVFFVVLFSYLSIFGVWTKLNSLLAGAFSLPQVMLQNVFNPVSATLGGLSVFLAIAVVFLVGTILVQDPKQKKKNIFNWLLIAASLFLLVAADFSPAWIILLVSLLLFVGFALWKRVFREDVNKLLLPILLIVAAAAFLFINVFDFQLSIFQLPKEKILDQDVSWITAGKSSIDNVKSAFWGSGIGTFHYDFSKFKTAELNQDSFWQVRFDRPGSYAAEVLGTMGFLGILSYLFLIGFFLFLSYKFIKSKPAAVNSQYLILLLVFLALLTSHFVYYQNTVLAFVFWLILGLSALSWQKPLKEKVFSFKDFPELSLIFSVFLIILGVGFLGLYCFALRFYLADASYLKAFKENMIQNLERAVSLNPYQPQYKIVLARAHLNEVLLEMQKPPESRDQIALSNNIQSAIAFAKGGQIGEDYIKGATELAPNMVAAWETLGMVYRDLRWVATGAQEWAVKAFETAVSLEPMNPILRTELGKIYFAMNEVEKAREEFQKAKALRPDYADASIQLALVYEGEENLEAAVREMESLAASNPFNAEIMFQLGRIYFNNKQVDEAITQLETLVLLMPNHSNAHYSLGVAYSAKGETEKAIAELEKVLELNPGNQDVEGQLNDLREAAEEE